MALRTGILAALAGDALARRTGIPDRCAPSPGAVLHRCSAGTKASALQTSAQAPQKVQSPSPRWKSITARLSAPMTMMPSRKRSRNRTAGADLQEIGCAASGWADGLRIFVVSVTPEEGRAATDLVHIRCHGSTASMRWSAGQQTSDDPDDEAITAGKGHRDDGCEHDGEEEAQQFSAAARGVGCRSGLWNRPWLSLSSRVARIKCTIC